MLYEVITNCVPRLRRSRDQFLEDARHGLLPRAEKLRGTRAAFARARERGDLDPAELARRATAPPLFV